MARVHKSPALAAHMMQGVIQMGESAGSSLRASASRFTVSRRQRRTLVALSIALDGRPKIGRPRAADAPRVFPFPVVAWLVGCSIAVCEDDSRRADVRTQAASIATMPELMHRFAGALADIATAMLDTLPAAGEEVASQGGEGTAECASLAGDEAAEALAAARARLSRQRRA